MQFLIVAGISSTLVCRPRRRMLASLFIKLERNASCVYSGNKKCVDFIKDIRQENEWTLKLIVISTGRQASHSQRRQTIHTIFCQPSRILFTEISR